MEGAKKNPDKLNTVAIVTVGAVGCALVYLSIVGLQSFYVNETAAVDEQAKFGDQDEGITSQVVGKKENADPADQWNTVAKMAKKRAHVDAILTATAASDLVTQDLTTRCLSRTPSPRLSRGQTTHRPNRRQPG